MPNNESQEFHGPNPNTVLSNLPSEQMGRRLAMECDGKKSNRSRKRDKKKIRRLGKALQKSEKKSAKRKQRILILELDSKYKDKLHVAERRGEHSRAEADAYSKVLDKLLPYAYNQKSPLPPETVIDVIEGRCEAIDD